MLAEFAPEHIICTHFLPAELLAHDIKRRRAVPPVWVQVTDFDLHRMWVQPGMRGYFAASDEIAFRMVQRALPRAHVRVTGIPLMPAFSQNLDRTECAGEIGIKPDKPTLLLMTGGAGIAGGEQMIERLLALPDDFQVIALAVKMNSCWRTTGDSRRRMRTVFFLWVLRQRSNGLWPARILPSQSLAD